MPVKTIVSPTTSARVGTAPDFTVSREGPATLSADALATTEEVDIYYRPSYEAAWKLAVDSSGTALVLTATAYQLILDGVGEYKIDKDATASACGVYAAW